MKDLWAKYSKRVDELSQRERIILFSSLLVLLLAIVDTVWLSPAQSAQKQLSQRFTAQSAEVNRLRIELQSSGQPVDVGAAVRAELARTHDRLVAVEKDIAALAPASQGGPDLEKVLLQFLRRQEGLTLVSTGTLKQEAGAATGLPAGMSRQGMELRVSGAYPELVRYVKTLEAALPALRWGPMVVKTAPQGTELTLQVYVVGVPLP
jgi:MSHA biogenesis protein MshJ